MSVNTPSQNSVLRSGSFYRLKQNVQSPGDIYEIDTSAAAIYVGPESDLTEYRLTYFDPDRLSLMETADLSVGAPFVGSLPSLLDTRIASTNQLARVLASPVDLFVPGFQPRIVFPPVAVPVIPGRFVVVPPVVDLLFAFIPTLAGLPTQRADRTLRLSDIAHLGADGIERTDVLIPAYGRRIITVDIVQDFDAANIVNVSLSTLTFDQGAFTSTRGRVYDFPPAGGTIAGAQQERAVLRVGQQFNDAGAGLPTPPIGYVGTFDYLVVSVRGDVAATPGSLDRLYVQLSDREV